MAIAEACVHRILCSGNHFCVDLDVLDHCSTGSSNDDPVLISWQEQPDSDFKFPGISLSSMIP